MRRFFLVLAMLSGLTGVATAQPFETVEDLVESFYAPYFDGEFYEDESPFRSAALNALYERDYEASNGEMGALSFDPFIDGQDFDIADFVVGEPIVSGAVGQVEVSFTNFGLPKVLTIEVVWEDQSWRIDDVVSDDPEYPYRLTEIFAEALGEVQPIA
jgi:hypothetical protein